MINFEYNQNFSTEHLIVKILSFGRFLLDLVVTF